MLLSNPIYLLPFPYLWSNLICSLPFHYLSIAFPKVCPYLSGVWIANDKKWRGSDHVWRVWDQYPYGYQCIYLFISYFILYYFILSYSFSFILFHSVLFCFIFEFFLKTNRICFFNVRIFSLIYTPNFTEFSLNFFFFFQKQE